MLQIINYFFVPALAVLLHEREKNPSLRPSLRLLAVYLSYTAAIIPCTRVMTSVIGRIFSMDIFPATAKYTLLALLTAAALPGVLRLLRAYVSLELVKRGDENA